MKAGIGKPAVVVAFAAASALALAYGLPDADEPAPASASPAIEAGVAAPRCEFSPGERAAFALESTVRDVRAGEADHLRGTLSWEVAEQLSPTRWRLRAALSDVSHSQTLTRPEERVRGPLTDAFFVDVDASCRLVEFGFTPDWDAGRRRLVRSALAIHEFVMPPTARARSWTAVQTDGLGSFEALYSLAPGQAEPQSQVVRRTTAYDDATAAFGVSLVVVDAEATATFDGARPRWLSASSGHERVQIRVEGQVEADLLQRFSLVRDDGLFAAIPPLSSADADFRDPADLDVAGEQLVVAGFADRSYEEALAALLGRFADAEAGADPSFAAARELAAWLASHPEGAAQLAEALRADAIADAARPALFLGLELSGTDEARRSLSELLVDPTLRSVDRARAASALADIGEPTLATAELLLTQAQTDGDAMVANVSLLGVGTLAKRSGDEQLQSYVRGSLEEALFAAGDGEVNLVLDAIGNSGDSAFADALGDHLAAASPTTRQHAARALGKLDPADAGPRLLDQLGAETDPKVGAAIVKAYRGPASSAAIAAMADKLAGSDSKSERAALIAWLGAASRSEPAAQRRLVAHARLEADTRLLQQIGAYVPAAELQ